MSLKTWAKRSGPSSWTTFSSKIRATSSTTQALRLRLHSISSQVQTQLLKYTGDSAVFSADSLGHPQVMIHMDGEKVIKLATEEIKTTREAKEYYNFLEATPWYSSQSRKGVGPIQKVLQGDLLTLRYFLESKYKCPITQVLSIWPWLVRYADFLRERYDLKSTEKTAPYEVYHIDYTGLRIPFGASTFYQVQAPSTSHMQDDQLQYKADSRWHTGIFLGWDIRNNKALVGTRDGVITGQSVRRREASRAYDLEELMTTKGVPRACSAAVMKTKRAIDPEAPSAPESLVEPHPARSSCCSGSSTPKHSATEASSTSSRAPNGPTSSNPCSAMPTTSATPKLHTGGLVTMDYKKSGG